MTSDSKVFLLRGLGNILTIGGFILTFYLPLRFQLAILMIPGLIIMVYGLYLRFKSERRQGYIFYDGGRI
jgi:hypothetical protein